VVALVRRGEIWTANLNPNKGSETGKIRPVLILQEDALTMAGLPTILIVPMTTQYRPGTAALRVAVPARDRLRANCYAMVEQVRAVDRGRIGEGPLAVLTPDEIASVERSLRAALGMA
jgi:mRNA interferase MazF